MESSNHLGNVRWFFNQVRNRGPWDYKQWGSQYEDFGNFNFGATGQSCGFSPTTLLRAAGWAQARAATSDPSFGKPGFFFGMLGGEPPFGDDPDDQAHIRRGFRFRVWLLCMNEVSTPR